MASTDWTDHLQDSEVDGRIDWPDGTTFLNVRNDCCGSPYPLAELPDGHKVCGACADVVGCDCPPCEVQRALDEDDDRRIDEMRHPD